MIRAPLAIVSVVLIAWLAVLLRDALLIGHVASLAVDAQATRGELEHGVSLTKDARLLNPDRGLPLSWQAEMYLRLHQVRPALRTYQRLVAAEPQFADAWFLIAAYAARVEPPLAAHASAELKQLDPRYPR